MWNKLFKSKSKSSKNLSSSGGGGGGGGGSSSATPSPPLDLVPIYNIDNRNRYEDECQDVELRRNHNRDSIGPQGMCGIPMRKSKISSAFKSLSLRRGSSKNQLKLYPGGGADTADIPDCAGVEHIQITDSKRASLRPSKSDNNLNEKQNYADQEKENSPVYLDHDSDAYRPHPNPFLEIPDPPENLELQSCPICSRNFVPTSLVKHIGICEKMQTKKRKPFDSSRQRREGTELASYLPKNFGLPQNHPQARASPPKTTNPVRKLSTSKTPTPERKDYSGGGSNANINNTMSRSQTLDSTMSSHGGGNTHQASAPAPAAAATGSTTTPRPILKRSLSQQNEPCPYCERCFGFKAYDRHVEWCREKALLNKNIQHQSSVAKERLQARIQYKAPQLKSKRALNREKYSGSLSCGGSTSSLADLDLPFPRHRSHLNSMSSSLSSDNGYTPDRYDPFLSAKRQLEELFSPTSSFNNSTTRQQTSSRVTSPVTPQQAMSKSVVVPTNKPTSPNITSNFRRASSLRMPRKVSRPMYIEKAKSNIQKGITDDGPVSPNFLKSSEYDEIPIKSVFNAAQMAEKPKMRDSSAVRRNLKLDIKDPNMPATDIPLSKTDSLAVFLKYEHELNLMMSEKEMKDKSNSLSKRSSSLSGHERKESQKAAEEKSEKPVQEIQPIKKLPQKLVPIKLDPINITYNNNSSLNGSSNSKPTVPMNYNNSSMNDSSKSKPTVPMNYNNNSSMNAGSNSKPTVPVNYNNNSSLNGSSNSKPTVPNNTTYNNNSSLNSSSNCKPTVISLDAILGKKKADEKPLPRKESNYIDPKLINKCDNLPIMVTKLTKPEVEPKPAVETPKVPEQKRPTRPNVTSPETEGGGCGDPPKDNRLSDISTKSDDDPRPTLTRQNGTASRTSTSSSDSCREESPPKNQSRSSPEDAKSASPDSGLERSTPKPSTPPIAVQQKKPERPPLPSFDDFDFEEFISSFEDERRSFQNAFYTRNATTTTTSNNTNSSSSFSPRVNASFTDNSVKNGSSNSNTSSPSHFASPLSSHQSPYYKSLHTNGRSEEDDAAPVRRESPQVPPRRPQPPLPSIAPAKNLPGSPQTPNNNPNSLFSYGPPSDSTNNNNHNLNSPLVKPNPSSTSRIGSGANNSFNHSPITTSHQPYQQQPLPKTSPAPEVSSGSTFLDDLSPTERDLMKSVQELDRMCESSSSMYPADSADDEELSSVEGYPLGSGGSGSGGRGGGQQRVQRPSEGSKFSADSAYGSLSRQSPQQDTQTHTVRRTQHHHHHHHRTGGSTSQQQLLLQQDAFDNSSGSESSLPPITTATLKAQKIELHSHGSSTKLGGGPSAATAAAAAVGMSKFCHECGSRFMICTAKFCMECGVRRIMLE